MSPFRINTLSICHSLTLPAFLSAFISAIGSSPQSSCSSEPESPKTAPPVTSSVSILSPLPMAQQRCTILHNCAQWVRFEPCPTPARVKPLLAQTTPPVRSQTALRCTIVHNWVYASGGGTPPRAQAESSVFPLVHNRAQWVRFFALPPPPLSD